jgi:molybdate transport system substrate-binding protein
MRFATLILLLVPALRAQITIAAAADLSPLESALKQAYGGDLRFSFASSGSLLRQIENGAPFDVFLSASEQYIQEGIGKGFLTGPSRVYAKGRIALFSRSGTFKTLEQLRDPKVLHIAIANPAYAPYGLAAKQALEKTGLWKTVESRIVYGENIRQTLQYAESGNADVAIVSWSLVHDRGGILLPENLHAPVRQAGAVVKSSTKATEAKRFLDFLTGEIGRAVLKEHGL